MAVLKMLTGPMTGDVVALVPEGLQIGRGEANQLRIVEASVSSRHARIWEDQGYWWLQDLGSTNGTLVNNAEAPTNSPVPLTTGDKLAFGHVVASFDALMDLSPPEPEPLVAPEPSPQVQVPDASNARLEALQAALTAAQQQLVSMQTDVVPRSELEALEKALLADFSAQREAFKRQLRDMEQKLVEQAAEVQAFERSIEQRGVLGGLPSKEREALEASERERATLEAALAQANEREQALQAQLDSFHKELREISGVRRVAAAEVEEGQRRNDTLEQQIVVLERAVAVAQQDEEAARQEAARVEALDAELAAARAHAETLTTRLAEAEAFGNELRRELDRQQQATSAQEADLAAVRQQGVQLRERILLLEQQLSDAEGNATDELDALRAELKSAMERSESLGAEVEQGRAEATALEEEVARKTSAIDELEKQLAAGDEGAKAALEQARAEATALAEKLASAEAEAAAKGERITALETQLAAGDEGAQAAIQQAIAENAALSGKLARLEAELAAKADRITTLEAQLAAGDEGAKAAIEQALGENAALAEKLAGLEAEVAAKAERIAALETQLSAGDEGAKAVIEQALGENAALAERIAGLEAEVSVKAERIAALEAQLAAGDEGAKAAIEQARGESAALAERIAALEAQLSAGDEGAKAAIERARAESVGLNEKLAGLTAEVASKAAQIAALDVLLAKGNEGAQAAIDAADAELNGLRASLSELDGQLASEREAAASRAQELHARLSAADEESASLRSQLESIRNAPVEAPSAVADDWGEVEYARAKFATLRGLLETGTEAVNGDISRVRRNAEIFRGYLDDVDRIASFVTSLDASGLNPSEQSQWQTLIDEVGPSEVVSQLRAMADENADAASSSKGLVLELKNAVAPSESGADLEQALLAGQGLLPDASLPVESSELLPLLACETSEAVLFGYALAQEATDLGEGSPVVRLSREGDAMRLVLEPLSGRTRSRWTETAQGGGDDRSRFLHGFVTRTCQGDVSVDDVSDGCSLSFVFRATRPA